MVESESKQGLAKARARNVHRTGEHQDPIASELPVRIEPGEYEAVCYKTETGIAFGGRRDIYIHFRLYGGKYDGTDLTMICTFPRGKMSHRHKYYIQWTIANGAPPRKGERPTKKVFLNKMFVVLVRDTRRKHPNNRLMPDFLQYSVVDTILERITGLSPEERGD